MINLSNFFVVILIAKTEERTGFNFRVIVVEDKGGEWKSGELREV